MQRIGVNARQLTDAQRFQLLIEGVTDYAIFMLDPAGLVSSWNSGAEKIKGYSAGEIVGQHFSRFFTPEDREDGLPGRILELAEREGRAETEGWRVRKNGSRFWANAIVRAIREPDGNLLGFAKITRDITERMAAQEALRQSEGRFRLLVEGVLDYAIYLLDPAGIITDWNAGAERMNGYSAAEIIGHHVARFYTKDDRAAGLPMRLLDTALHQGRCECEGWRLRNDGSRFWAAVTIEAIHTEDGELLGFAQVTRDITERRAAQEALRESERQLRLFVRGVTDYALYMLDPNGIVTSWNLGGERIKGYAADEIIGQHFSRFYPEHERSAGLPARVLRMAVENGSYEAEGWRVRKDGSLFWAGVVIDPIRDEQGKLIGFAKITRDLTERRETQLALEKAQAERAHAQKMEALGQLTGGVAHDFNNLLMIVSGYVQRLKDLAAADPKGMKAVEAIEMAVNRGTSLSRQLLSFARRQTLNPVVVQIGKCIDTVRPMLASSIGRSTKLLAAIPPDVWAVKVDVSELELALINLILNSRDALPDGGAITITAENVRLNAGDSPSKVEGDFVAVTVADTGSGIAADILPKVFDPFFTTKQVNKGTGLGLSQVHGFIHQSGGTISIDSELGKGTRVTLYLPRATEEAEQVKDLTEAEPVPGGTALLVEDNPDVAGASVALLEQLGFRVQTVGDAELALKALEQETPDLVVSDIVMAGPMDGLGLARAIRKDYPDVAIILVTGYSSIAELAGKEFPVLRKPYQLGDLSRAAAKQIAEARHALPDNLVHLHEAKRTLQH